MQGDVPIDCQVLASSLHRFRVKVIQMRRPIPITIISILMILSGVFTLPLKLLILLSPDFYEDLSYLVEPISDKQILAVPLPLQLAHGLIGSLVWITTGLALWKGLNWGRWLAIIWAGSVLLLTFLAVGLGAYLLIKSATFAVMCFFLTNRKATSYFSTDR